MLRSRRRRSRSSSSLRPTCLRKVWPPADSSCERSRIPLSARPSAETDGFSWPNELAALRDGAAWQASIGQTKSNSAIRRRKATEFAGVRMISGIESLELAQTASACGRTRGWGGHRDGSSVTLRVRVWQQEGVFATVLGERHSRYCRRLEPGTSQTRAASAIPQTLNRVHC